MSEVKRKTKKPVVARVVEIPATAEALLDINQIGLLIGRGRSRLKAMIADGEYPKPDTMLGVQPRWKTSTHNEWVRTLPKPDATPANPFNRG